MTLFGVLAVLVILAGMLYFVRKAGQDSEKASDATQDANTAARVADAVAGSPHDDAELLDRLRDPKRPL